MDSRANIPPGLPRSRPTMSYWQQPQANVADRRTSKDLPPRADVVIVGSGISGASIAYQLLTERPNLNVVMLEARQAASGASGRNGGHTKGASYRSFLGNVEQVGREDAIKIAKLEYDCMKAVHDLIDEHKLECDALRCDTVDIFYDDEQLQKAKQSVSLMEEIIKRSHPVSKHTFYDPEETARHFLTADSLGSVRYEAGSLNAYKLTIGILKLSLSKGLNLQCNTPAIKLDKTGDGTVDSSVKWKIHTPRGDIRAGRVVLATNGYTSHLLPALQGVIVPFRGIVTAQRPGRSMPQTGLPTTYSFIYAKGYEYMITRPAGAENEGDVVIGGGLTKGQGPDGLEEYGNTDDTTVDPDISAYLTNCTTDFFGKNWGVDNTAGRVRHAWSGIMGYSADGYPLVGPVPGEEGLWIDASFQGHGMVLCFLCAKAVVEMMTDQDRSRLDEWFPQCYRVNEKRMQRRFEGRI